MARRTLIFKFDIFIFFSVIQLWLWKLGYMPVVFKSLFSPTSPATGRKVFKPTMKPLRCTALRDTNLSVNGQLFIYGALLILVNVFLRPPYGHNGRMKREKFEQLRKQFLAGIWIGAGLLVFGAFERQPVFGALGLFLLTLSAFRLWKISRVQPHGDEDSPDVN